MRAVWPAVLALVLGSASASVALDSAGRVTTEGAVPLSQYVEALGRSRYQTVITRGISSEVVSYRYRLVPWELAWDTTLSLHGLTSCMPAPGVVVVGTSDALGATCPLSSAVSRYPVRLRVLEIADSASAAAGLDWSRGLLPSVLGAAANIVAGGAPFVPSQLSSSLRALEAQGLARKLDDVRLTLTPEQLTEFRSGGTLQLSLLGQGADTKIERALQYGLTLGLQPAVQSDGTLAVSVRADLSSPVSTSNVHLLDIASRSVVTGVTLQQGAGVVVAAFSSARDESNASGLPSVRGSFGPLAGLSSSSAARTTLVVTLELV